MSDTPMPHASFLRARGHAEGNVAGGAEPAVNERLSGLGSIEPLPPSVPPDQRERIAQANVGLTMKGWHLARLLGVGPVSAAYEATRGAGDATVHATLRLMLGSLGAHEQSRSHFLRAAYAANRFQHPRILPITGDGTDDTGAPFVLRAWSDGEPLASRIQTKGTMNERQALTIAEQLLDVLEIAHAHGIVHGAIAPNNVLITGRGSIRLCDFATPPGMTARNSDEPDLLAARRISPWSAPERCTSEPAAASEACDVYALGATLFFAITGEPPRGDAGTPDDLARAAARPIRARAPSVSEGFASVVDRALASDPARRYGSAYAMLGDVRRVLAGRPPKLAAALKPIPSGSYAGLAQPPASLSRISNPPSLVSVRPSALLRSEYSRRRAAWKGNVALILAIALLVGVATFVMVREKVEDERRNPGAHPSTPSETR